MRARLQAGECLIGAWTRNLSPSTMELVGLCGWDFAVADAEHGDAGVAHGEDVVRAGAVRGMPVLVRTPDAAASTIARYLDAGTAGVQVPMVDGAEEAAAVVAAARYPPEGRRGLGGSRGNDFNLGGTIPDTLARLNAELVVAVQIETAAGLGAVEEIARVPGLDVLFVGAVDLSLALGVPGQLRHPTMTGAYARAARAVDGTPVALGALVGSAAAGEPWLALGARYLAVNLSTLVAETSAATLTRLRG